MNRMHPDLFTGLRTPQAPRRLRERALRAARYALDEERPRSLEERLWHARGLRLAWLATVVALLAINLVIPAAGGPGSGSASPRDGIRAAASTGDLDALPEPESTSGDRAAVLCLLLDDCGGRQHLPPTRGDRT